MFCGGGRRIKYKMSDVREWAFVVEGVNVNLGYCDGNNDAYGKEDVRVGRE